MDARAIRLVIVKRVSFAKREKQPTQGSSNCHRQLLFVDSSLVSTFEQLYTARLTPHDPCYKNIYQPIDNPRANKVLVTIKREEREGGGSLI